MCDFHSILVVREITKALARLEGKEKRLHLLMRVGEVLRGNLALEILLQPFYKKIIRHNR